MTGNHHILKKLVLTESSYQMVQEQDTFTFIVPREANKIDIRNAVQSAFEVRTISINTSIGSGKKKPVRGQPGKSAFRYGHKKAFVRIHNEDVGKIPLI